MDLDDRQLIERVQRGDGRAFDLLVARYGRLVLQVARSVARQRDDAEDIAQEALFRLFRSIDKIDLSRPLEGWLVTITVNTARTHVARRSARREEALPASDPRDLTPSSDPGTGLEARDVRSALAEAASTLTERERLVFQLRDIQGLDAALVGEALGITPVTVRRLSGNGRAKVVDWLRRNRPELLGVLAPSDGRTIEEEKIRRS